MNKIDKAIIGITTFCKKEANNKNYDKVSCSYIKVISNAGGLPVLIPLLSDLDQAQEYIQLIDGLLLSGGDDICPQHYGEERSELVDQCDLRRDSWELELFNLAYEFDLPILGVCRGMQLMNVARGGTLYQDLNVQHRQRLAHLPSDNPEQGYVHHPVEIKEGSNLCKFACSRHLAVNSYHHQAIKDLAPGFKVIASTEGEIVEAIEEVNKNFIIGVQWHPEDLTEIHPCFNELFNMLVAEAGS